MRILPLIALALLAVPLAACSTHPDRHATLTPIPEPAIDPDDAVLTAAVEDFLKRTGAPASSAYEFSRFDLDADGLRDAVVLFKNPYGYWCDRNGCTMLVLKAGSESFELVNAIQPIRGPLFVSQSESNGWKDLMVRVSGRWDDAKNVAIRYNGNTYAPNPAALPPAQNSMAEYSARLFMGG